MADDDPKVPSAGGDEAPEDESPQAAPEEKEVFTGRHIELNMDTVETAITDHKKGKIQLYFASGRRMTLQIDAFGQFRRDHGVLEDNLHLDHGLEVNTDNEAAVLQPYGESLDEK